MLRHIFTFQNEHLCALSFYKKLIWTHAQRTEDHIYTELEDLATGTKLGRTSDSEITLFKSIGLRIEEFAAAQLTYTKAKGKDRCTEINLLS